MKALLKSTKVFLALLCLANLSYSAPDDEVKKELNEQLNALAGDFLVNDIDNLDVIQGIGSILAQSSTDYAKQASVIIRNPESTLEVKLDSLLKLCNRADGERVGQNRYSAPSSSSRQDDSLMWLVSLKAMAQRNDELKASFREIEFLLQSVSLQNRIEVVRDMMGRKVTIEDIQGIMDELRSRLESVLDVPTRQTEIQEELVIRFASLLLPSGIRVRTLEGPYFQFKNRIVRSLNEVASMLLDKDMAEGKSKGLTTERVKDIYRARSSNVDSWSRAIMEDEVLFDANLEGDIQEFLSTLTPEFFDHRPEDTLATIRSS